MVVSVHDTAQNPEREAALAVTLALVFFGGAVGTLARALLIVDAPTAEAEFVVLTAINTVGAFALGALTGWLATRPVSARNQKLRALVGTGVIGGFTSYSTLALLTTAALPASLIFAVIGLLTGVGAAWLGLSLGRRVGERSRK